MFGQIVPRAGADIAIARASCELESIQKDWVKGLEDEVGKVQREVQILTHKFEDDNATVGSDLMRIESEVAEADAKAAQMRHERKQSMDLLMDARTRLARQQLETDKAIQADLARVRKQHEEEEATIAAIKFKEEEAEEDFAREIDTFKTRWRNRHNDYNVNTAATMIPGLPTPAFQTPQHVRLEHTKALEALSSARDKAQTLLHNARQRAKGADDNVELAYGSRIKAATEEGRHTENLDYQYQRLEEYSREILHLTDTLRTAKDNMALTLKKMESSVKSKTANHDAIIEEQERKSQDRAEEHALKYRLLKDEWKTVKSKKEENLEKIDQLKVSISNEKKIAAARHADLTEVAFTERALREESSRQIRSIFNELTTEIAGHKNNQVHQKLELSETLAQQREHETRANDLYRSLDSTIPTLRAELAASEQNIKMLQSLIDEARGNDPTTANPPAPATGSNLATSNFAEERETDDDTAVGYFGSGEEPRGVTGFAKARELQTACQKLDTVIQRLDDTKDSLKQEIHSMNISADVSAAKIMNLESGTTKQLP